MVSIDSLLEQLTSVLAKKQYKIVTAESCTGGLLAQLLTDLPGSSAWFERGFVTYSNESKQELLGVKEELLLQFGAVSQEVVESMALGALKNSHADLSVAISGIAGPGGGTKEKPVGTVWIGFCYPKNMVTSLHCYFPKTTRLNVRKYSCEKALKGLLDFLHSQ